MGERAPRGVLYVIVCAAPPAAHVQDLVKLAQADGWEVAVTATPEALAFVERPGRVVRFVRLMQRPVRVRGGPAVRAACGGDLSLPWLPLTVLRYERRAATQRRPGG
jgi:hypothetical protein